MRIKILRELHRVGLQFLEPYYMIRDAIIRHYYNSKHHDYVTCHDGESTWSEKIAIFLIHQPVAVPKSVIMACDYLKSQGYSCILVSNGQLSCEDLRCLLLKVSIVIVRPNFGYDFGGYQEAIFWLRKSKRKVNRLLIMNDSVWFPVLKDTNFLMDMENKGVDLVGALSAQRGAAQYRQRKLFYASFMLLFSEKVWNSPKFNNFWSNYIQTSSKYKTIRKGERLLTSLFINDSKYSCHAMIDLSYYNNLPIKLQLSEWPAFASNLCIQSEFFSKKRDVLLFRKTQVSKIEWYDWYYSLCQSENMFMSAQTFLVLSGRVPLIKKSNEIHNILALQKSVDFFKENPSFDPEILEEILLKVGRR